MTASWTERSRALAAFVSSTLHTALRAHCTSRLALCAHCISVPVPTAPRSLCPPRRARCTAPNSVCSIHMPLVPPLLQILCDTNTVPNSPHRDRSHSGTTCITVMRRHVTACSSGTHNPSLAFVSTKCTASHRMAPAIAHSFVRAHLSESECAVRALIQPHNIPRLTPTKCRQARSVRRHELMLCELSADIDLKKNSRM